jgi:hypothetical protein
MSPILLVPLIAGAVTVVGTHVAADRARMRARLAYHRRLTRRNGRMLQRPRIQARGEGWR